jgi:hypothetical protein
VILVCYVPPVSSLGLGRGTDREWGLGTSPLYVLNGIWSSSGDVPPEEDIIGGVSAIIWAITILPLLKYVSFWIPSSTSNIPLCSSQHLGTRYVESILMLIRSSSPWNSVRVKVKVAHSHYSCHSSRNTTLPQMTVGL